MISEGTRPVSTKFELTEETKNVSIPLMGSRGHDKKAKLVKVLRIRALKDLPEHRVKAGDLGGWLQYDNNLSHTGQCWVADDSVVTGDSKIEGSSLICGNSIIDGKCYIRGYVNIENSRLRGGVTVTGGARIRDSVLEGFPIHVRDRAIISHAEMTRIAFIGGDAYVDNSRAYLYVDNPVPMTFCKSLDGLILVTYHENTFLADDDSTVENIFKTEKDRCLYDAAKNYFEVLLTNPK
jgi:hypothetical protein